MWRMKFEQTYKKVKFGIITMIILTIGLSIGMFMTSLTLANQIRSLHQLIPTMNLTQKINTQMLAIRVEFKKYMESAAKKKEIDKVIGSLKDISGLVNEQAEKTKDEMVKDNMKRAGILVETLLVEIKKLPEDKIILKTKEAISKLDSYIENSSNFSEINSTLKTSTDVANALIIISFFVAFFIGGGLIIGMAVYVYISRRQMEKVDRVMSLSMVDELTNLYNKHYFEERIVESLNRVQRFKKPLAVVFVKVHFPSNLSHETYPFIFKELAERLLKGTRAYDVNARFGEDMLSTIIHEVGEKETDIVVKRLKSSFEQKEIAGTTAEKKKDRGFFGNLFGFGKHKPIAYKTYIKVLIGGVIITETSKITMGDIIERSEEILRAAEVSKEQVNISVIKGEEKRAGKT